MATPVQAYALTSVQQGMLFHRLHAPRSGVDIEQMVATLREPLDVGALRQAWQLTVAAHPALRTRLRWEGIPSPVQEVLPDMLPSWSESDLTSLPEAEQRFRLEQFLREDRQQGVELDADTVQRVHVFRLAADDFRVVWTFPHLILDGGSFSTVVEHVFSAYDALRRGAAPHFEPRPAYADHIAWLAQHVPSQAERARSHFALRLEGFASKNQLSDLSPADSRTNVSAPGPRLFGEVAARLDRPTTERLRLLAAEHGLTLNTFVQGAWALTVSDFSTDQDVVFGVVRASRRSALPEASKMVGLFINTLPLRASVTPERPLHEWLQMIRAAYVADRDFEHTPLLDIQSVAPIPRGTPLFDSVVVYNDALMSSRMRALGGDYEKRDFEWFEQTNFPLTLFGYGEPELLLKLSFDPALVSQNRAERMLDRTAQALVAMGERFQQTLGELERIPAAELELDRRFNSTDASIAETCIHEAFEAQVARAPQAIALVFRDQSLTYRELDERANRVARRLQAAGAAPDAPVGLFVQRSLGMLVGLLGILKAGAAYVPLDPSYPTERVRVMLEDSHARLVLTDERSAPRLPQGDAEKILLDEALQTDGDPSKPPCQARADNLAYVIFTSGSTGRPKGVMVEHRNVANFFAGMDQRIGDQGGTWLAVTSISFDISVLELFWTLARGFKVVIQEEADKASMQRRAQRAQRGTARRLDFSLFYFSADAEESGKDRYRLLLEGARFADRHDFSAVWTPERHFHAFGGLYPNPSVTSAALATITERVQLRAGSVVLPLHNPLRVAEEWSVVDNLSNGRVGLSFASGWHANDFALMPDNFAARRELTFKGVELIRKLWRGEAVTVKNGAGADISVSILPRPVQKDPPIWLTTAGNVETFRTAGQLGVNVLTNMLGQSVDDLREKFAAYRQARRDAGHEGPGYVSLMLHTFIGRDVDEVRELVRAPFTAYLKTSTDLVKKARWEFPAFGRPADGQETDRALSPEEEDALMAHAFERYFKTHGLFGSPEGCLALANSLREIGVDEIACLIDFGVTTDRVLAGLQQLNELKALCNDDDDVVEQLSISQQIERHQVTHFQCTPSLARLLLDDPEARPALSKLHKVMLGGEALPPALADELLKLLGSGQLLNMYGPTETTVWSTTARVRSDAPITLGEPFANTQIRILDKQLRPSPPGVPGELCIGGAGVARGYWGRPELTSERFITDRTRGDASGTARRLYRTGDLARFLPTGSLEFLGRLDHQVKLRGYRIELGEIEAVIAAHPSVREAVCVVRTDKASDSRLVAYATLHTSENAGASDGSPWREIWDEAYRPTPPSDPRFDTSGWNSSYTDAAILPEAMQDWLGGTVSRIQALGARRILEIGCGTGLLLYRLAPHAERYVGADFSQVALDKIRAELGREPLRGVELLQADALDLQLEPGAFDAIVINSVVQYFPSVDYLTQVIERVLPALSPGGALFLGDIRALELLEVFHASVALAKAAPGANAQELKNVVERRMAQDSELLLSPAYFDALLASQGQLADLSIEPKRGRISSELQAYRYDVTLRKAGGAVRRPLEHSEVIELDAAHLADLAALRDFLQPEPLALKVSGLANRRVAADGWEPEDLYAIHPAYRVELVWGADGKHFDAWLIHNSKGAERARPTPSWARVGAPQSRAGRHSPGRDNPALREELRARLSEKLPDYMVPSAIVFLDRLPLTPNGKIDRKALPAPDEQPLASPQAFAPPKSDTEKVISTVWAQLLRAREVSINDNLFDLGANSLLVMQANAQLRSALGKAISLVDMFQFPSVAALAAHLDAAGSTDSKQAADAGTSRAQTRREAMERRRRS